MLYVKHNNIKEGICEACLIGAFCELCSSIQMNRDVKKKDYNYYKNDKIKKRIEVENININRNDIINNPDNLNTNSYVLPLNLSDLNKVDVLPPNLMNNNQPSMVYYNDQPTMMNYNNQPPMMNYNADSLINNYDVNVPE